jgi:hypothetical protein
MPARGGPRWCSSIPQNHRPGQLAAHIALGLGYHLERAGGWQDHRKGQLRVLGSSPSALPTPHHPHSPLRNPGGPGGHRHRGPGTGSPRTRKKKYAKAH